MVVISLVSFHPILLCINGVGFPFREKSVPHKSAPQVRWSSRIVAHAEGGMLIENTYVIIERTDVPRFLFLRVKSFQVRLELLDERVLVGRR